MFVHKVLKNLLSGVAVVAMFVFANVGSAYAATGDCNELKSISNSVAGTRVASRDNDNKPTGTVDFYSLKEKNTFGVTYGDTGLVMGSAVCSTVRTDTLYGTVDGKLEDTTGTQGANYCYCNISRYQALSGEASSVTMPWVAYNPSKIEYNADTCAKNCASVCANALASREEVAYRSAAFEAIKTCEMRNNEMQLSCTSTGGTWSGNSCSCSGKANSRLRNGQCTCNEGYTESNNVCVYNACVNSGGTWTNNACSCSGDHVVVSNNECACASGYTLNNGSCVSYAQNVCLSSYGTWSNNACTCPTGRTLDSNGRCVPSSNQGSEAREGCDGSQGTWANDSCTCNPSHSVWDSTIMACVCASGYHVEGGSSLSERTARCEPNSSDRGSGVSNGDIKIATVKYNVARFSPIEDDLETTVGKIKDVVTQVLDNTSLVANVQTMKQTRPLEQSEQNLDKCPSDKTCLLVTAPNQTPKWYEIIDCNELAGLDVTFDGLNVAIGPGEPFGFKSSTGQADLMCGSTGNSITGCQNDEWVTTYDRNSSNVGDTIVFGSMRRVAIGENIRGTVVELPNGVVNGDVCVCKATRYKVWDSGTSGYGDSRDIDTDKWFVAGINTGDYDCLRMCADDRIDDIDKTTYYQNIANSCYGQSQVATMCRYYPFFETVATNGVTTNGVSSGFIGSVGGDGVAWGACAANGVYYNNSHCATTSSNRQTWIAGYYSESHDAIGYIYGRAGYATLPSGTQEHSTVDLDLSDISSTGEGHNAKVCVVQGYKAAADATETSVMFNKVFVVRFDENGFTGSDNAAVACAEIVTRGETSDDSYNVFAWYRALSNMCVAY